MNDDDFYERDDTAEQEAHAFTRVTTELEEYDRGKNDGLEAAAKIADEAAKRSGSYYSGVNMWQPCARVIAQAIRAAKKGTK